MKEIIKCIKCEKEITEDNYNIYSEKLCEDCNNFHMINDRENNILKANGIVIWLCTGTVWCLGVQYISDDYKKGDDLQEILEEAFSENMIPQGCIVDCSEDSLEEIEEIENSGYFPLNGDMQNYICISHIEEI